MTKILPFLNEPGIRRKFIDNEDGTYAVVEEQACDSILERNKAMYTHNDGYSPSREMRRVASVPTTMLYRWIVEEGFDARYPGSWKEAFEKVCKRNLNSSEYLYLRTAPGRI